MSTAVVEQMAAPTIGMELVSGDEIALNAPRHLFLAGDLLDPARRKDINLPGGGEEIPNRCMWRTGGLLPRCEITPMEMWGDPQPYELFPEGVRPLKLKGAPIEDQGISNRYVLNGKPLFFVPIYPGELIVDALGIPTGERRGIVEIEVLRGIDYGGPDREFQTLFFGPDYVRPVELRLIEEHIQQVADSVADPDAHSVAADMLKSCNQFREYAQEIVSKAQTQLQERVSFQHTHRLTPKIRSFMAQLEIKPPADGTAALQDSVMKAVANSGITPEMLNSIMAQQSAMFASAVTEAIKAASEVAKPVPTE